VGNSVEVLGVGRDRLKEPPRGLEGGQVLLALILFGSGQSVPEAFQGAGGRKTEAGPPTPFVSQN
jgi:hypothetical protein